MSERAVRPGDFVLSAPPALEPAGRIESVLHARSGERLLIALAFSRGRYIVCAPQEIVSTDDDSVTGLRWHTLDVKLSDLLARGTFRRVAGRLTPDPLPSTYGAPHPDADTAAEIGTAIAAAPLTKDAEIVAVVRRGVAVIDGWIGTVAGKVAAERITRLIPGVWEAVNRIVSDEELRAAVGDRLRADERFAQDVEELALRHGRVTITLRPGSPPHTVAAIERAVALPGVREVAVRRAGS